MSPIDLYVPRAVATLPTNSTGHSVLQNFCVQVRSLAALAPNSPGVGDAIRIVIGTLSLGDRTLMAEGVAALCALLAREPRHGETLLSLGGVTPLIEVVRDTDSPARALAAEAIASVGRMSAARSHEVGELLRAGDVLPALVKLVHEGPHSEASYWGTQLLDMLASLSANDVCDEGAIGPIFTLLCSGETKVAAVAADALTTILRNTSHSEDDRLKYVADFAAAINRSAQLPLGSFPELMQQLQQLAAWQIQVAQEAVDAQRLEEAIEFGRWCRVSSDVFGNARARRKEREKEVERQQQLDARRAQLGLNSGAAQKTAMKEKSRRRQPGTKGESKGPSPRAAAPAAAASKRRPIDASARMSPPAPARERKPSSDRVASLLGGLSSDRAAHVLEGAGPTALFVAPAPWPAPASEASEAPRESKWAGLRRMSQTAEMAKAFDTRDLPRAELGFAAVLRRSVDGALQGLRKSWFDSFASSLKGIAGNVGDRISESFRKQPSSNDLGRGSKDLGRGSKTAISSGAAPGSRSVLASIQEADGHGTPWKAEMEGHGRSWKASIQEADGARIARV